MGYRTPACTTVAVLLVQVLGDGGASRPVILNAPEAWWALPDKPRAEWPMDFPTVLGTVYRHNSLTVPGRYALEHNVVESRHPGRRGRVPTVRRSYEED